tara:strand:+ start:297 stop:596 length:300 start_codon:yes stop_codon:yes gene_type:complete
MRDEHMLMYALVFVIGFMVARMMGGRLVEGREVGDALVGDECYKENFDKGKCKRKVTIAALAKNVEELNKCDNAFTESKCPVIQGMQDSGYRHYTDFYR